MKVRVYVLVGLGLALVAGTWLVRRYSRPPSAKQIAKDLSVAAKTGAKTAPDCAIFFSEFESLVHERSYDEKRVGRIADQIGRYPGIPGATFTAWKALTNLPEDQDVDVSFAFGLSDCQYGRFSRTAGRLANDLRSYRKTVKGCDRPVKAMLGVLREVLDRPIARQVLESSVGLALDLKRAGWVRWEKEESADWSHLEEYVKKFNRRADEREGALTKKLASFSSFKEAPPQLRKGLAVQLRYSYTQTERVRGKIQSLISRLKPGSE